MSVNPNYNGKKPGPEHVEFNEVEDPGTRLAEVKTGQANFAFDLPAQLIPQITSPAEKQLQAPAGNFQILFNNKDNVLSDPRIRRAINFALDREALTEVALGGETRPNSRYWPETFKAFSDPEVADQQAGADQAAAERELKGTACESGCKLNLAGRSSAPWMQPLLLAIQQQLGAVGIEINAKTLDSSTIYEQEETGEFQMIVDTFLDVLPAEEVLVYENFKPGPPLNAGFTNFESAEAEKLVEEFARTPVEQRGPLAKKIGDLFAEEVPWAGIADLVFINASNLPESVIHGEVYELRVE
jgi:ABC-type transport system substrate-binding protein